MGAKVSQKDADFEPLRHSRFRATALPFCRGRVLTSESQNMQRWDLMPWRLFIPVMVILVFAVGVHYAIEVGQSLQALVQYMVGLLRELLHILS